MNDIKHIKNYMFLSDRCEKFFKKTELFENDDLIHNALIQFCDSPKKENALEVYGSFSITYRIPGLEQLTCTMREFEENSSKLISSHRDHYIHSVNVFLLGIAFYASNAKVRDAADRGMQYPDNYPSCKEEFLYRWGLTSLFHDVGYPIEIAFKTILEFSSMIMIPRLDFKEGKIIKSDSEPKLEKPIIVPEFPALDELLYINNIPPKEIYKESFYEKYPEFLNGQL